MNDKNSLPNLIPSFQVDHTKIVPGIYISRTDTLGAETVTTYDIRMKYPNLEPAIHPNAMHTIEHLIATYLRNEPKWKDQVVYWGPMGCLTGSYLIMKGAPDPEKDLLPLLLAAFRYLKNYEGEIPGATQINCGNWRLHDLATAKWEAAQFVQRLETAPAFTYPVAERLVSPDGHTFFDS